MKKNYKNFAVPIRHQRAVPDRISVYCSAGSGAMKYSFSVQVMEIPHLSHNGLWLIDSCFLCCEVRQHLGCLTLTVELQNRAGRRAQSVYLVAHRLSRVCYILNILCFHLVHFCLLQFLTLFSAACPI